MLQMNCIEKTAHKYLYVAILVIIYNNMRGEFSVHMKNAI